MEVFVNLVICFLPIAAVIFVYSVFMKKHGVRQERYIELMKVQNENLERIAKALEQKNGTDVT
ncbi:MAG: hypothetical protein KDI90_00470 [Alphaproteobacteria bacterium]|nr:hypothetical protein [Alphaproteobacteria bacterium]MCB9975003.1 hypothetical protein [Rhodospirillales bacterium]